MRRQVAKQLGALLHRREEQRRLAFVLLSSSSSPAPTSLRLPSTSSAARHTSHRSFSSTPPSNSSSSSSSSTPPTTPPNADDDSSSSPTSSASSSLIPSKARSIVSQFVPFGHAPRLPELLIVPVRRPTFPGLTFDIALSSLPPSIRTALQSLSEKRLPYVGLFLHRKDQAGKASGWQDSKAVEKMEEEEDKAEIAEVTDVAQVHDVGVLVQFVLQGDRMKGHVHRRLRMRGKVEEREGPLLAHVDYIEDAEQKRKTKDSAVNVNSGDAVDEPTPSTSTSTSSSTSSSSTASSSSSGLLIGVVDKFEFDACMKEIHASMAELGQQSDLQKRSLLTQSRIINATIDNISPSRLADLYASFTNANPRQLQEILETLDPSARLVHVLLLLKREQEEVRVQMQIMSRIQEKMAGQQNKHLLREQKKMIDDMLGNKRNDKEGLRKKYEERLQGKVVPQEVQAVLDEEMAKLQSVEAEGQEFNVIKNYLDWLTILPWGVHSPELYNLAAAERVLQRDHYGLEDVKQRVLEIVATASLLNHIPSTKTLCLVGPPGTGQTPSHHATHTQQEPHTPHAARVHVLTLPIPLCCASR